MRIPNGVVCIRQMQKHLKKLRRMFMQIVTRNYLSILLKNEFYYVRINFRYFKFSYNCWDYN
ncbi:MAG: hypothetical protein CBC48_13785 [bacterium TMED88]|nr:MAG: hypothetical protein CBC48_13785 [bacterium TMED88]